MFARKIALVIAAGIVVCAVLAGAEEQVVPPGEGLKITLKETALCDIDAGMMRGSLVASADLRHVAYVARPAEQKTCFVALDGAQGKAYDGVSMLTFSGDSKRLAYVARSGERYVAVVDGVEGPQYDDIAQVVFSPDSKRVAYRARVRNEDNWAAVVDGVEGRHYSAVGRLVFSPDSARVAYSAWSQYGEEKGGTLVVDGAAVKIWDGLVSDAVFSGDSKRLAYGVKPTDGTWQAVVADGVEGKHYERLAAGVFGGAVGVERLLLFSGDSKRLAYVAMTGGKWAVVVDGAEGKGYDEIFAESLVFSPDGARVAYFASEAGEGRGVRQYLAVVDGAEGGKCVRVFANSMVFSADSKRVAYCVDQLGQTTMFGGGGGTVVIDGEQIMLGGEANGMAPVFSADSKRVAYVAKAGPAWKVMVDKKEGKPYTGYMAQSLAFTPDSKHAVYIAGNEGKLCVVVDEKEAGEYTECVAGGRLIFDGAAGFHGLFIRGDKIYSVDVEISE